MGPSEIPLGQDTGSCGESRAAQLCQFTMECSPGFSWAPEWPFYVEREIWTTVPVFPWLTAGWLISRCHVYKVARAPHRRERVTVVLLGGGQRCEEVNRIAIVVLSGSNRAFIE